VGKPGVATTCAPCVGFKVAMGDQVYVTPPKAVKVALSPRQMVEGEAVKVKFTLGTTLIVWVTLAVIADNASNAKQVIE
jgi:hypothetical protein